MVDMLNGLNSFLQEQGVITGLLILFAVFLVWRNFRQNEKRLADKDAEIKRLAEDVHDMRDRLMALWDQRHAGADNRKRK